MKPVFRIKQVIRPNGTVAFYVHSKHVRTTFRWFDHGIDWVTLEDARNDAERIYIEATKPKEQVKYTETFTFGQWM